MQQAEMDNMNSYILKLQKKEIESNKIIESLQGSMFEGVSSN